MQCGLLPLDCQYMYLSLSLSLNWVLIPASKWRHCQYLSLSLSLCLNRALIPASKWRRIQCGLVPLDCQYVTSDPSVRHWLPFDPLTSSWHWQSTRHGFVTLTEWQNRQIRPPQWLSNVTLTFYPPNVRFLRRDGEINNTTRYGTSKHTFFKNTTSNYIKETV
jgi:hypothetical protein